MKICVIIPVYNEADHIGQLVADVKKQLSDVVVVDDGSRDGSAESARPAGAVVLTHETNRGKGAALATGFAYALKGGWDAVLIMDGDGQHACEDIRAFCSAAEDADVIVGNRLLDARNMPLVRYLTNRFMSFVVSRSAGCRIPDSQCGFRLIRRRVLATVVCGTEHYEAESELLVEAARQGYRIVSVPVKTIYRKEKSKIRPFTDTIRFIKLMAGLHGREQKHRRR